jgi:tetratricopeptide (TPR) repeat protein
MKTKTDLFALVALGFAFTAVQAQNFGGEAGCGSLANPFGPYDYRTAPRRSLKDVNDNHFNPNVQQLRRGQTASIAADLDYVLRAFPNHHPALDAMLRLWIKQSGLETGFLKPLDCYLDRSLRFAPDDPVPPLLFASYFAKLNRKTDALSLVDRALRSPKAWALTHFNAGLVLMELGEAQRALEQAHLAMAQGLNRPDLRDALMKAGAWREPTADKGSAATTPATAASAASES